MTEPTKWVMVPREPTPEMTAHETYTSGQWSRRNYEAIISAAPTRPSSPPMDVVRGWEDVKARFHIASGSTAMMQLASAGDRMAASLTAQAKRIEGLERERLLISEKHTMLARKETDYVAEIDELEATVTELRAEAVAKFESWEKAENEYHDKISALTAEVERLTGTLERCKQAILSPINKESIACTVWVSDHETLVDFIDAVLLSPTLPTIKGEGK